MSLRKTWTQQVHETRNDMEVTRKRVSFNNTFVKVVHPVIGIGKGRKDNVPKEVACEVGSITKSH